MSNSGENGDQREFRCEHCNGKILVPHDLPPTTGPCPHCKKSITSPTDELPPGLDPIFGKPIISETAASPPPLPKALVEESKRKADEVARLAKEKAAKEVEQRRIEAEAKAEQDREAAEKAAADAKAEEERQAAEAKAEKEREAAAKAAAEAKEEQERQAAEAKAKQERESVAKVAAEAKAAAERAERERVGAAKAAEEKALQQKHAEAARQQAEREETAAARAAEDKVKKEQEAAKPPTREVPPVQDPPPKQSTPPIDPVGNGAKDVAVPKKPETPVEPPGQAGAKSTPPAPASPEAEPEPESGEKLEDIEAVSKVEPEKKAKRKLPLKPLAVMLVLFSIAVGAFFLVKGKLSKPSQLSGVDQATLDAQKELEYLESGWEVDARRVLAEFLDADTVAEKARHVIRGGGLRAEMEAFYSAGGIDDSDTPESAFSVFYYALTMKDRQRGIFMLTYDQPPAFELSEYFTPLAPLDVKYQLREPDMLLAAVGRTNNFTVESLQVHALFKRSEDGLKLDWETFVQTKHRTLRDFLELPEPGRKEVFRVIVSETVPEIRNAPAGHRTYLIADHAHQLEDSARVYVPGDSNIGRAFSILNWRGTKGRRVERRSATIELAWSNEMTPRLSVSRFICWEFLGVGGEALDP